MNEQMANDECPQGSTGTWLLPHFAQNYKNIQTLTDSVDIRSDKQDKPLDLSYI